MSKKSDIYPPAMRQKIIRFLHMYPAGLTRDELRKKLGLASPTAVSHCVRDLLSEEVVVSLKHPIGNLAQKLFLKNREAYNAEGMPV